MTIKTTITAFTSAAALSMALGGNVAAQGLGGLDPLGSSGPSQEEYDAIQICVADHAAPEDCIRDAMKPIYDDRLAEFQAEAESDGTVTPEEEAGLKISECAFEQMPDMTARHYPTFVLGYEAGTNMDLVSTATDAEFDAFKNLLRDSYNMISGCVDQHAPQEQLPPVGMVIDAIDNFRAQQLAPQ